jgi:hypothetical protein
MARTLTSGMNTAVAGAKAIVVRLIQLEHSGGTERWATSAQDVEWSSQTWTAIGGALQLGGVDEVPDLRGAGMSAELAGVDGTVLSVVMTNAFRGYEVLVYRAHIKAWDAANAGTIIADPVLEFRGFQNGTYRVIDDQRAEELGGGTVTVKTRWVSRLAKLQAVLAVRTNLHSHRDYLRRGGLSGTDLDDDLFKFLPGLAARVSTIRWGASIPARYGGAGGARAGLSREGYTRGRYAQ